MRSHPGRRIPRLILPLTLASVLIALPAFDEGSAASGRQRFSTVRATVTKQTKTFVQFSRTSASRLTGKNTVDVSKVSVNTGRHPGRTDGGKTAGGTGTGTQTGDNGHGTGDGGRHPPRWPHHPHFPTGPIGPIGMVVGTAPVIGVVGQSNATTGTPASPNSGSQPFVRRAGTGVPPANERRYVPDEVVVEVASSLTDQQASALALRHRLARLQSLDLQLTGTTLLRLRIPDRRTVPAVVRALEADGVVMAAQPNYIAQLVGDTAIPVANPSQYAPAKMNLPQALALARGDSVLVAVVDSGIDATHPELEGMIADSFDAVEAAEKARPQGPGGKPRAQVAAEKVHPHGTAVAGAIVGHARMMGVAPAARILAVRAFAPTLTSSEGTTVSIEEGINWAALHGARVINMSFAGAADPAIARSLAAAHAKGIVLVAASGNNGPNAAPQYPAADGNVIAVTATDAEDNLFKAAVRGKHIAVAAPGVDIYLPSLEGTYQIVSGTSFSSAEVSGAVALMLERRPDLDPAAVRRILMATAHDLGPAGFDPQFGAGLVDAYQAVQSLQPMALDTAARTTPTAMSQ